jgi:hypothetical protein
MVDITLQDIEHLATESGGMRVSIYIPTKRSGGETMKNSIRLKNRLKEAEAQLEGMGWNPPEIAALLDPGFALVDEKLFREQQKEGLALFLDGNGLRSLQLASAPAERVYLGDHFQIKPLFQALALERGFYVLALSEKDVRLLEASRDEIQEVKVSGVPSSMQDALQFDDPEKQLQHHSQMSGNGARGSDPAGYHGHGGGEAFEENNYLRFFQAVDQGLQDFLLRSQAPLVLAGVDYLLPIYHEANNYPHLIAEGIGGNPTRTNKRELLKRGWEIVEPRMHSERDAAVTRYRQEAHLEHCSDDIDRILQGAYGGQVDTLFVRGDVDHWGSYDLANNRVTTHNERKPESADLLNLAAIHTLLNSGTVYTLDREEMPLNTDVAAILRY